MKVDLKFAVHNSDKFETKPGFKTLELSYKTFCKLSVVVSLEQNTVLLTTLQLLSEVHESSNDAAFSAGACGLVITSSDVSI